MKDMFCKAPYVRAHVMSDGRYRNCCAVKPEIQSRNRDIVHWWHQDQQFQDFKQRLSLNQFPSECSACEIQERTGPSLRTSLDNLHPIVNAEYPREWHIIFGSVCNLACWTCNENFSTKIQQHKIRTGLLPHTFVAPNDDFKSNWPDLQSNILKSYEYHSDVTICILGGEPAHNPLVYNFIEFLIEQGYSKRTKLEITTNGTKNIRMLSALENKQDWQQIHVFISVDAIGERAEWIRYDSNWSEVNSSIDRYIGFADYVEIHTTLSILNIQDLPSVRNYVQEKGVNHTIIPLIEPGYMSLMNWDGPDLKLDPADYRGLESYLDLVGQSPRSGSYQQLLDYIAAFGDQRRPKPLDQKF